MTRLAVMPYLTARDDTWRRSDWLVSVDDGPFSPLADAMSTWDYDSALTLQESTSVDVDAVRSSCALSANAGLVYVVVADCEKVGRRDIAFGEELPAAGTVQIEGQFAAAAGVLAGSLRLTRQIVLAAPDGSPPPAATKPGAILLSETGSDCTDISLEDGTGRFPTEVVDFAHSAHPDAVWKLSVDWDTPDESFASAVRLSLNGSMPVVQRLLDNQSAEESKRVTDVITWDIQRQLLAGAAMRAEAFERDDFLDESLGGVVQRLVRHHLGLADIGQLRSRIELDANFEELVQARARLFHD